MCNDVFTNVTNTLHFDQIFTPDWMNQLSAIYGSMPAAVEIPTIESPFESLSFLKDIDFHQDYINLTEDDCDSINTILQPSDTSEDAPLKISKGKIAVSDFIKTILIPILSILLPTLLTIYYHKIDSIESQKRYIEELQLKEKELQLKEEELHIKEQQLQNDIEQKKLLENILIETQSLSEYFESLQEDAECPPEIPEPFAKAPHSPDGTQDNDWSSPDMTKNSESAMHKE